MEKDVTFHCASAILVVRGVVRAAEHYRDVLGFTIAFTYGDPAFYAGVERGHVNIHLHAAEKSPRQPGQGAVYIFVTDVDAHHEQIRARGATILKPPQDYPYGMRDIDVQDLDGNQLSFGCESKSTGAGAGAGAKA